MTRRIPQRLVHHHFSFARIITCHCVHCWTHLTQSRRFYTIPIICNTNCITIEFVYYVVNYDFFFIYFCFPHTIILTNTKMHDCIYRNVPKIQSLPESYQHKLTWLILLFLPFYSPFPQLKYFSFMIGQFFHCSCAILDIQIHPGEKKNPSLPQYCNLLLTVYV